MKWLLKLLPIQFKIWLYKLLYNDIAEKGEAEDTELAHINAFEAQLLKRVGGLGDIEDLIAGYESNSDIKIDQSQLDIWQLYGSLRGGVICMMQTFAHLSGMVNSVEKAAIGRRV